MEARDGSKKAAQLSEADTAHLVGSSVMPPPPMKTVVPQKLPIEASDFEAALSKTKPTGSATTDYTSELLLEEQRNRAEIVQNVIDKMNNPQD